MVIDISHERLITFNEAAKMLPRGSRPAYSTWWRWWRHGVCGVRLATIRLGGRRLTSEETVRRFLADVTAAAQGEPTPARTANRRNHDRRQARQALVDAKVIDAGTSHER